MGNCSEGRNELKVTICEWHEEPCVTCLAVNVVRSINNPDFCDLRNISLIWETYYYITCTYIYVKFSNFHHVCTWLPSDNKVESWYLNSIFCKSSVWTSKLYIRHAHSPWGTLFSNFYTSLSRTNDFFVVIQETHLKEICNIFYICFIIFSCSRLTPANTPSHTHTHVQGWRIYVCVIFCTLSGRHVCMLS